MFKKFMQRLSGNILSRYIVRAKELPCGILIQNNIILHHIIAGKVSAGLQLQGMSILP